MSYLKNIGRFSGEDNVGGLLEFVIARAEDILFFPPSIDNTLYNQILLKPGKSFYKWQATQGTAVFRENEMESTEGKYKKYEIPFEVPKDGIDRTRMFSQASEDRFIVIFRDSNQNIKVLGTPEIPARFSNELNTGTGVRTKNGYNCKFYLEGTSETLNFYGYEMPEVSNTPANGEPVNIKKNGVLVAVIPAGSTYEIPPTTYNDLAGNPQDSEQLWTIFQGIQESLISIGLVLQSSDISLDTLQEIATVIGNINTAINQIHERNKDTALDEGGENEVTVEEIRDFIDENKKEVGIYSAIEQVSLGQVREYNDKFWEYIFATPSTGVTPVEGTHWKEISKSEATSARASQAEAESAVTAPPGTLDDSKIIGLRGLSYFFAKLINTAITFAAKVTHTLNPRFSGVNPSQVLKVDANKDLTSGPVANNELATMPALSIKLNNTNAIGAPTDFQAAVAERVLVRGAANAFAFIQLTSNYYADLSITQAKIALLAVGNSQMAQMPANSVKSNLTGVLGPAADNPAVNLYHSYTMFLGFTQDENPDIFTRCPWTNVNDVSIVSINGSTARVSLMGIVGNGWGSKTRKAYTYTVGQEITIELMGLITIDTATTFELRGLIGAAAVASSGANAAPIALVNKVFYAKVVFTVRSLKAGAVLGKMDIQGFLQYEGNLISMANTALIDFDNTIDNVLDIDGQFIGVDANSSIKCTKSKILIAG